MKRIFGLLCLSIFSTVHAETFIIDSKHTLPIFEINHLGFSTQRGRFNETQGTIELDQKARKGQVKFKIVANSIDMGQPEWDAHLTSSPP